MFHGTYFFPGPWRFRGKSLGYEATHEYLFQILQIPYQDPSSIKVD